MAKTSYMSTGSPLDRVRQDQIRETAARTMAERNQAIAQAAAQTLGAARASGTSPEQTTRGRALASTALGNPDIRLTDPATMDALEARVQLQREQKMLTDHPRTAQWASDYNNAAMGHDDLENVGAFESAGRAISKRTDAIYDGFALGGALDKLREMQAANADAQLSLDEIMADERERQLSRQTELNAFRDNVPENSPGYNTIVRRDRDADPSELTPASEMTAGARGLWRWVKTRGFAGDEKLQEIEERLNTRIDENLADRAFEAGEREALWPTPNWRADIEQKIGSLDGTSASDSFVGMMKVFGQNPARSAQYLMEVGAENGLTIAAGIGAGVVTRSPVAAATVMGTGSYITSSELYFDELVHQYGHDLTTEEGRSAFMADPQVLTDLRDKSKAYGLVVGFLDGMSAGVASKALLENPVGNMMVQMLAQGTLGGSGELFGRLAADEEIDWTEVFLEAFAEMASAPLEVGGMAVSGAQRRVADVQNARRRRTLFDILSGNADASTLRQRDRDAFADAIQEVTENGPAERIFVDPDTIEELFQGANAPMSIEEFFDAVPDLDFREFTEARDTGSQYVIPTGVYAAFIAGTELDSVLKNHIRMNADDMTLAEADEFMQGLASAQADLEATVDRADTLIGRLEGPLADEFSRLSSEIVEAQGITTDAAQRQAGVLVASARAGAQRTGLTVSEYLRRYTLPTIRNAQDVGAAPEVSIEDLEVNQGPVKPAANTIKEDTILGPDGEPVTLYHGTNKQFSEFKSGRMFFTNQRRLANDHALRSGFQGARVVEANLALQNPLQIELGAGVDPDIHWLNNTMSIEAAIRSGGHDSVMIWNADGELMIIATGNDQITQLNMAEDQTFNQQARGSIILPADGSQASINVMDTADLSTILHETGHFFLWQLQRQANDGLEVSADMLADVQQWWMKNATDIAKEAGIDEDQVIKYLDDGKADSEEIGKAIHTALHEQFARGFEAYVMEGKSPSNALRALFESFAAWLLSIYRQAKNLNVNMDDTVRSVFDRMLTTEEELAAGMDRESISDMIAETARDMGLDEETYARLVALSEEARDEGRQLLRSELLKAEHRMQSAAYKARLAEITAEETDAVNTRPVNRAIQWLGNGRWLGGSTPDELPLELRLDTDTLKAEHGADIAKSLPRGRRAVHKKGTGLSADDVAGWFGFGSGAEMLKAMVDAPKASEEIKARVRTRASEELGDIIGDRESIETTVDEALHGEKRGQVIVAEMRAINRLSGGRKRRMTTRAMASFIARDMVSKMPVREAAQTHRFQSAERRQAELSARLLAEGNIEGAFDAKRKQLIQHALYIESRKVNELVGKAERLSGQLKKKSVRANLARDYLGAIDDILETYSFRKVSGKSEVRRERLLAYVEGMTAAGRASELAIPAHVLQAAKPVPYKTLSVQRLQGVYDSLKNIEHTARRKQKLLDAQGERELQEVIDEMQAAVNDSVGASEQNRVQTRTDRIMSETTGYFNLVRNADTVLRRLDNWKDRGIMYRFFKDRIDAAGLTAVTMREKATNDLEALFDGYSTGERQSMSVRRMWDGYDQALSKWDIISIALNMGNKDNLERLTSNDSRGSFTREQVDTLVDNLTKSDWDFVQSVWDHLDEAYWPQIRDREQRMTGVAPAKVEGLEVETKFGTLRGGYYPISYDPRYTASVGEDRNRDMMESMMAGRFGKAQTKNGHTKERASGGGGRTIELGMHVLFGHINHVVHDLAHGEAINQTWSLLQNPKVKRMFEGAGRLEDHKALELWVQDVAAGPAAGTHVMAGFLRRMKSGFTVSKLAFNMSTVAVQVTGLAQSISVVGANNLAAGIVQYGASGFKLAGSIIERSDFMRKREETFQRDVADLRNSTQLDPMRSRVSQGTWYMMQAGFWAMQKVQFYVVDVPTWLGAHRQGLGQGMSDAEAATHADRMVARAQASGLYADRTAIERGTMGRNARQNEFLRLFTTLGSYMFAKFNVANEVVGRTKRDIADSEKSSLYAAAKGATDLVLLFTVEALLYNAIKGTLPGMGEDGDDDDSWAKFIAAQTALSVFSTFPFVRDMTSAVQGFGGGGAYGGISETFGRALSSTGDLLAGEANAGDARSANDLLGMTIPGYPSTAVWRLLDGAGVTGEEPSPLAVIMGR